MSLTRKAIREKIVELLTNETDAEDRVFASRVLPVWASEQLPCILVYTPSDAREIDSQPKRYSVDLQLRIEIIQKASSGLDGELDTIGSQVEYILDQDFTLGNLVQDIVHTSTEMVFDKEGETEIGSLIFNLTCRYYKTSTTDPAFLDNFDGAVTDWLPNDATTASPETEDQVTGLFTRTESEFYKYGYPAEPVPEEPDVMAQWIFDEVSGNIRDKWALIELEPFQDPVYGINSSDYSPRMERSIYLGYAAGAQFYKAGVDPNLVLSPGPSEKYTIECVFKWGAQSVDGTVFEAMDAEPSPTKGWRLNLNRASGNIQLHLKATDGTQVIAQWPYTFDQLWHKLRITLSVGDGAICEIDEVEKGVPVSIATLSGKTIPCSNIDIGSRWDNSAQCDIYLNEFRVSNNDTNNSGGPG